MLATAVAAHAALQVLAFLDGDPAPPAVDGTLEISRPTAGYAGAPGPAPGLRLLTGAASSTTEPA